MSAARRVFIERGYSGATLEAIAEEAGFSKGVMYSQFANKADLFLTLLDRRIEERSRENQQVVAASAGAGGFRRLLEVGSADWKAEMAWFKLLVEFRAVAARDPATNARYAAAHRRTVDGLAADLKELLAKAGLRPSVPPRVMAQFMQALVVGATLERIADPSSLPFESVSQMVARAFGFADQTPDHGDT